MKFQNKSKLSILVNNFLKTQFRNSKAYIEYLFIKSLFKDNHISLSNNYALFINTEQFGDIVLSIELIYNLHKAKVYDKIYYLVNNDYKEFINAIIPYVICIGYDPRKYKRSISYKRKLLKELNTCGFNEIYNISPERGIINDELTILTNSNYKIGIKENSLFLPDKLSLKLNKYYSSFLNDNNKCIYHLYRSLALKEGINTYNNFEYEANSNVKINVEEYIVVAPFSTSKIRNWDIKNFYKTLKVLGEKWKIYIIGSYEQYEQSKFLNSASKKVINVFGKTSLADTISIIKNCKLFIGLDSGMTHLAKLLNVPTIAIIGGGKYGQFFPYKLNEKTIFKFYAKSCFGCNWNCIYESPECIDRITPEEIINNSLTLLNAK